MATFQIGPAPNAVSCLLDPTRLPAGQIHCNPSVLIDRQRLRATGAPTVLRDLMNARFQAQTRGITVEGVITGGTISVRSVAFQRRVPPPPRPLKTTQRPTRNVALSRLTRMTPPPPNSRVVVLFETIIEGIPIRLTAEPPPGVF